MATISLPSYIGQSASNAAKNVLNSTSATRLFHILDREQRTQKGYLSNTIIVPPRLPMPPKSTPARWVFSAAQQHKDIYGSSAAAETKIVSPVKIHLTDVLFGNMSRVAYSAPQGVWGSVPQGVYVPQGWECEGVWGSAGVSPRSAD